RWDDYQAAYEAMLTKTSTDYAPWYIVPANRKWYRNLVISKVIIDTLEGLNMTYPPADPGLDQIVID
ncbi:MAG: polyphosphate kinase 2 family protein, partial [Caldilineaceae bacterium]